ncbi:uncharacterized protein LAJ45_02014 [Morchella importuna]|uniref:uncharacterized protein n=1 Tax=Morchella importuna TaxID=1174673 RepID=UPI001E8D59D0|nr:uncharacterized protein LAJ45_02014 [Morchella importuna]KAH8154246.1 hypothetical protein LAJ45_02014 [Morchella importuna]
MASGYFHILYSRGSEIFFREIEASTDIFFPGKQAQCRVSNRQPVAGLHRARPFSYSIHQTTEGDSEDRNHRDTFQRYATEKYFERFEFFRLILPAIFHRSATQRGITPPQARNQLQT